jgi:hypothetical protein
MSDEQARLGLVIGGGVVGAFFGVPGLGLAIGGIAGSLLISGPDPPRAIGPQLGDLQVQVSSYGTPIPVLFGTVRVAGNIIWNSDIREIANKSSSSSAGGKGGSPKQESITFSYEVDLQIELCRGPIDGIGRVWANDQLFYDFANPPHAKGINAKIYFGTTDQKPDPTIEADKGVGNVPAYRGTAYIMIRKLDLTPFNNGIPTLHFEVHANGDPTIPVIELADDPVNGGSGRVAIDPDTGLIWATRTGTDKVDVYQCNNGLTRICSHDVIRAHGISYMPAFVATSVDFLGTITTGTIGPKMWVATNTPDGLGGEVVALATDASCRVLETVLAPFNDAFTCWPGQVIVDVSSIPLRATQIGPGPTLYIGITNGACSGIQLHGLNTLTVTIGIPLPADSLAPWNQLNGAFVADWVATDTGIAAVDSNGLLFIFENGVIVANAIGLASFSDLGHSITWDPEEGRLYTKIEFSLSTDGRIAKWDKDLNKIWEFDFKIDGDAYSPTRVRYHQGVGDVWAVGTATGPIIKAKRINKESGGFEAVFEIANFGFLDDFQPFPGAPFAVGVKSSNPGALVKFPLGQGGLALAPSLAQVVTDIVELSDSLTASDIDVSLLAPFTVRGYSISKRQPVRAALQPLMQAYFFDAVESDDVIKFVPRGAAPVATIPSGDMNARRNDRSPGTPLEQVRTQENELPTSLDLRFISHDTDFKIGVVQARRLITESQQIRTVDMPIVYTSTEARSIVDVLIHNIWFERTKKTFTLSKRYFALEPTDIVTITSPDQGPINVRLNQVAMSLPNILDIDSSEEDISVYAGFISPGAVGLQPQPGLLTTAPVVLIIMDTSTLRDIDNNTGLYVVAYAIGGPYDVSSVLQSPDGITYGAGALLQNEGDVGFAESQLTWEGSFS